MPADEFYDNLNDRLAGEQFCLGENDECEECGHPIRLHGDKYGCEYERGDAPGDGEHCAVAFPPCGCKHGLDRAATFPCPHHGCAVSVKNPLARQKMFRHLLEVHKWESENAARWSERNISLPLDRASTQQEVNEAIQQEQILEASRSVRKGTDMLFAALRQNGVL